MKKIFASLIVFLLGTMSVMAYEYPTDETVRYALNCMDELGGQTDDNLYTCACRYDVIKKEMSFIEYDDAATYERNKDMPGEKGGFFRASKRGEENFAKLTDSREMANSSCIVVKHVQLPKKSANK